jgi:hypothetical protein
MKGLLMAYTVFVTKRAAGLEFELTIECEVAEHPAKEYVFYADPLFTPHKPTEPGYFEVTSFRVIEAYVFGKSENVHLGKLVQLALQAGEPSTEMDHTLRSRQHQIGQGLVELLACKVGLGPWKDLVLEPEDIEAIHRQVKVAPPIKDLWEGTTTA